MGQASGKTAQNARTGASRCNSANTRRHAAARDASRRANSPATRFNASAGNRSSQVRLALVAPFTALRISATTRRYASARSTAPPPRASPASGPPLTNRPSRSSSAVTAAPHRATDAPASACASVARLHQSSSSLSTAAIAVVSSASGAAVPGRATARDPPRKPERAAAALSAPPSCAGARASTGASAAASITARNCSKASSRSRSCRSSCDGPAPRPARTHVDAFSVQSALTFAWAHAKLQCRADLELKPARSPPRERIARPADLLTSELLC